MPRSCLSIPLLACLTLAVITVAPAPGAADVPDFNRDIQPILSENCYHCHGPDAAQRKAGLRLDQEEGALAVRKGRAAVVRGKPGESELVRRVGSKEPDEMMPPPD